MFVLEKNGEKKKKKKLKGNVLSSDARPSDQAMAIWCYSKVKDLL